jgi:hypothetical protein
MGHTCLHLCLSQGLLGFQLYINRVVIISIDLPVWSLIINLSE